MADLRTIGRVTHDLEPKRSHQGALYLRFTLAERIGRGETAREQYFEVWAWDDLAQSLLEQKIGRGARLWVRGFLELVDYVQRDGTTRDKRLKLRLRQWSVLPPGVRTARPGPAGQPLSPPTPEPLPVIDGERETLPG